MASATVTLNDASTSTQVGQVLSDAAGSYSLTVANGTYNLVVTPPDGSGFAISPVNGIVVLDADKSQDVALVAGAKRISGVIRSSSGVALNSVYVTVKDQVSGQQLGQVITGVDGAYAFALAAGTTYSINLDGGQTYGLTSLAGAPYYFSIENAAANITLSADAVRDITVPFVKLSGKTTDANGVAVANVKLTYNKNWGDYSLSPRVYYNNSVTENYSPVQSDAQGNYTLWMLPNSDYTITIIPPVNSGFATTPINHLSVLSEKRLNAILSFPDVVPPVILSGPTIRSINASSAVVEWQTDEPTRGSVKVGGVLVTIPELSTHSVLITGLTASTAYTAEVSATDASGNGPTVKSVGFSTAALPDTVAPVILEGPAITGSTNTTLVVEWTTNEPAEGTLSYGVADLAGSSPEASFTTQHRIELSGLTPNTAYQVQVNAKDVAGNGPTLSRVATGRTLPTPDTTAPVITNGPLVSDITDSSATVAWKTDEPSTGGVSWNNGTAYGVLTDAVLSTDHRAQITGLLANTDYHLTVSSTDALGNGPSLSKTVDFHTQALGDTAPPEFLGAPTIVTITHQSAVIRWETDEPADGRVNYGILSLNQNESKTALIKKHFDLRQAISVPAAPSTASPPWPIRTRRYRCLTHHLSWATAVMTRPLSNGRPTSILTAKSPSPRLPPSTLMSRPRSRARASSMMSMKSP